MGAEMASSFASSSHQFLVAASSGVNGSRRGVKVKVVVTPKWQCHASATQKSQISMKNEMKLSTFSSRITTDMPLHESSGASFDQYLTNRSRVFEAIFPDKRRSKKLNEEEWKIHMLPINFLFLTVWPVVDMRLRCKSHGTGYPAGVPLDATRVLELDIIKWELQGLDTVLKPSDFTLVVQGILYPDRSGVRSRLKGQLEMKMSFVTPPVLALVPQDVLQGAAELVLRRLVENMKAKVNGSLLHDFAEFKRESLRRRSLNS